MEKCAMSPYIKNSAGKIVESKLFNDLFSTFKDRGKAWKYYSIATNSKFLNTINQKIETDSNGEITISSFMKIVSLEQSNTEAIQSLEKSLNLQNQKVSYEQALAKVNSFNRHDTENPKYMATLVLEKDGLYSVHIVQRNKENKETLKQTIKDKLIKDKLIQYLNDAGVEVSLSELGSKYSTLGVIERSAKGLYQLIDLWEGADSIELAEEAGHFIIGASTNTPLYSRLQALFDKGDWHELFTTEELKSIMLADDPKREAMGRLVGKALHKKLSAGPFRTLIDRILNYFKRILTKLKSNQIKKDLFEIETISEQLASSFIGKDMVGSISNALSKLEVRYNKERTETEKIYDRLTESLSKLSEQISDLKDPELEEYINSILLEIGNIGTAGDEGVTAIALGISRLNELIIDLQKKSGLNEYTMHQNAEEFIQHVTDIAPVLLKLRAVMNAAVSIKHTLVEVTEHSEKFKQARYTTADGTNVNLRWANTIKTFREISNEDNMIQRSLAWAEKQITLGHLKFLMGADYIEHTEKLLWHGRTGKEGTIYNDTELFLSNRLDEIPEESGFWIWIGTAANSKDIVTQLYDKALKTAIYEANRSTELDFHKLKQLEDELQSIGVKDQSIFFEKDEQGNTTNNLVTDVVVKDSYGIFHSYEVRWAKWEQDYLDFMKQQRDTFEAENKEKLRTLTAVQIKLEFERWSYKDRKQWHDTHSVWDVQKECYAPNYELTTPEGKYVYRYDSQLTEEQKEWLKKYRELKENIDDRIDGHMPTQRAPQFTGTFINIIKNNMQTSKSKTKGIVFGIWEWVKSAIQKEENPEFFGSEATYNDPNDEKCRDSVLAVYDQPRRVPFFGINKIKNTKTLSTDLISSTIAYAAMANRNAANSQIADVIRIGINYRTSIHGHIAQDTSISAKSKKRIANSVSRLENHIDKHLYGIGIRKMKLGGLVLNNIARALSIAASKTYLGGNSVGGNVNAMTGIIELAKEAFAGEYFTSEELRDAMQTYFKAGASCIADHFVGDDYSKMSLFAQRYQITSSDEYKYSSYGQKGERIASTIKEDIIFGPYSLGEHFMQLVPFIAMAKKQMLYNEKGEYISLWDSLVIQQSKYEKYNLYSVLLDPEQVDTGQKKLDFESVMFRDKKDIESYNFIKQDIENLTNASIVIYDRLSDYTKDYLRSKKLSKDIINDPNGITKQALISILKEHRDNLTYNNRDDSAFQQKVREITNRMHGVYNTMDKPMLHRTLWGNMLLTMKGYAIGLLERRFGTRKYSVALGHETEGSMNTLGKVIKQALVNKDAVYGIVKGSEDDYLPNYNRGWRSREGWKLLYHTSLLGLFTKNKEDVFKNYGLSDWQYKNIRRAWADRFAVYALSLLKALSGLGRSDGDDDDEDNYWLGMLYYFSTRVLWEQAAYTTPGGISGEMGALMGIMPVGVTLLKDVGEFIYYGVGALMYDGYDEDIPGSTMFYVKTAEGEEPLSKFKRKVKQIAWYAKDVNKWEDWYKATDSWLYTQKIKK